tara:strand:+ start:238 stop:513 length:276 start_codon:yes stop_codon:yes gene_type:complete
MGKTKMEQICEEVAYDLELDPKLVKQVVREVFVEVVSTIALRKQHIMLRGFAKIVFKQEGKSEYKPFDPMQYETRNEEDWKKQDKNEQRQK